MSKTEKDIKNLVDAQIASLRQDIQSMRHQVEDMPNIVLINAMEQQQQVTEAMKQETKQTIKTELEKVRTELN